MHGQGAGGAAVVVHTAAHEQLGFAYVPDSDATEV